MKCLNCGQEMTNYLVTAKNNQISYDICEKCGSFWLDAGELNKMSFQVAGSIEFCSDDEVKSVSEPIKKCPRCEDTALFKVSFVGSDIVLDHCRNCGGFWLDGGELDLCDKELEKIMPLSGKGFSEFVNDVHLPYWCKKIKRQRCETDFKIEVPPIKGAKLKSDTTKECPSCKTNLNLYTVFGIDIEGCPKCKGLWLDKDELRILKDRCEAGSWTTLRWLDDEIDTLEKTTGIASLRICPNCNGEKLISTCFGDTSIILDWCPSCHGIWVDRNEFEDIVLSLKAELNYLSSQEMKQKLYEEIRELWTGPENEISEILDVKAALSALINITIFEHPKLVNTLMKLGNVARSTGGIGT